MSPYLHSRREPPRRKCENEKRSRSEFHRSCAVRAAPEPRLPSCLILFCVSCSFFVRAYSRCCATERPSTSTRSASGMQRPHQLQAAKPSPWRNPRRQSRRVSGAECLRSFAKVQYTRAELHVCKAMRKRRERLASPGEAVPATCESLYA